LVLFEHVNTPVANPQVENVSVGSSSNNAQKSHVEKLASASEKIRTLYDSVCDYISSLGDDLVTNQLKLYLAYKKVQNVFCIEIYQKQIVVRVKLNPDTVTLEEGFTRDTRNIGHYGTGDLEISIKSEEDFYKAKELLKKAYDEA
jgi:Uncharacterized conserved protein